MGVQITLNTYDLNDMSCNNEPVIILSATKCSPGMGLINIDNDNNILSFNNIDNIPSLEICNSTSSSSATSSSSSFEYNTNNRYYNIDECFEDGGNERSSKFIVSESSNNPTILKGYCNQIKMFDCDNYYIHSFKNNTCFKDNYQSFTLMYCDQDNNNIYFKDCLNSNCSPSTCFLNKILSSNINKCSNFNITNTTTTTPTTTTTNTTAAVDNTINNNNITNTNNTTGSGQIINKLNNTTRTNINSTVINNNNNNNTKSNHPTNNNKYFYPKTEQSITSDSNKKHNNNNSISSISLTSASSSSFINLNLSLLLSLSLSSLLLLLFISISYNYF